MFSYEEGILYRVQLTREGERTAQIMCHQIKRYEKKKIPNQK